MAQRKRIAFYITEVADLSGGGGAERFFADLFQVYNERADRKYDFYFITDHTGEFNRIGKLKSHLDKIIRIRLFRKQLTRFRFRWMFLFSLRLSKLTGDFFTALQLAVRLKKNNITVLNIPHYKLVDYPIYRAIDRMPAFLRPQLSVFIVDCRIPFYYDKSGSDYDVANKQFYGSLFDTIKIDALYTWYESFKNFAYERQLLKSNPLLHVAKSRFTVLKTGSAFSEKQKWFVTAGRLDCQKNHRFFIEAVHYLVNELKVNMDDWQFKIFGKGPLYKELLGLIEKYGLGKFVSIEFNSKMEEVFEKSSCYVSTQDFENFPSLAMAEAMAKGNLILSRNVGQTRYFVKDNVNGFLLEQDSPRNMAEKMQLIIGSGPEKITQMGKESIFLLEKVHTVDTFVVQLEKYYDEIINK